MPLTSSLTKVAVITGAARGIGLAAAQRFYKENYQVVILDRDQEAMARCKEALKGQKRYSFFRGQLQR